MLLYHYSSEADFERFVPRAPLRHPDAEPLVYALHPWYSPLYLFPRDCPRIGMWLLPTTSKEDEKAFRERCAGKMRLFVDRNFEEMWRTGVLYRYEFDSEDGFIDCKNYGDWVSRAVVIPRRVETLTDLPKLAIENDARVEVVPSLAAVARSLLDEDRLVFKTTLHVSMVRMSLLPDWEGPVGGPSGAPK